MRISCVLYFVASVCKVAVANGVIIQNPSPVPLGGVVEFVCNATSFGLFWIHNASDSFEPPVTNPGGNVPRSIRLVLPAISVNNNTNIKCQTAGPGPTLSTTTQLYIYSFPSEPSDLSSESVSDGVLVFSWFSPWAPDGVQLSYTVTVININTSVVRNYTTSNTSITLTRSDVEGDGECDQYVWSVTAVNPAGISGPANYSTAESFVPAPNVTQHNVLFCNENSTLVITIKPPTEFAYNTIYTVNVLNTCSNAAMEIMNNLNQTFHIPDIHMWTNITVIVKNQCRESLIPVRFNSTVICPTSHIATTTINMTVHTPSITTPQSPSSLPTSTTNPTVGPVWAYGIGVILLLLVAVLILALLLYCCWRKRNKLHCGSSSVKMESVKMSTHEQTEVSGFENENPIINTDKNVAYGTSVGIHVLISHDTVQYEQVDVPTADTGFTMSTNTAYSTITHH